MSTYNAYVHVVVQYLVAGMVVYNIYWDLGYFASQHLTKTLSQDNVHHQRTQLKHHNFKSMFLIMQSNHHTLSKACSWQ